MRVHAPLLLVVFLCAPVPASSQPSTHPLDSLTLAEHWIVYDVIRDSGRLDENSRFAGVSLHEPPKSDVLAWKPGALVRREAKVILMLGSKTVEALVDIGARTVTSWRDVPGVQPDITGEELTMQDGIAKANPEVLAALKRRGITDLKTIECVGVMRGYFAVPAEGTRRLAAASCLDRHGVENQWGRPIEGLTIYIDLHDKKVFRVVDTGPVPVPSAPVDFHPEAIGPARPALAPIRIEQPLGPGFSRDGGTVTWDRWQFHVRLEPRRGAIISQVRYKDGDRSRSVLYQGSISELFVPYMDPDESWYHRTFFDAGEFGHTLGLADRPLQRGTDCPDNAVWIDLVIADERGVPHRRADVACLFERAAGDVLWRHREESQLDSRAGRDLVVRWIATLGNYDYVFDWAFQQDGSIRGVVGATGVAEVKGVKSRTAVEDGDGHDGAYGHFVSEHTVAPNHDHFFSYRLDLDVDGTSNSLVVDRLEKKRLPEGQLRKSLWVANSRTARVEADAMLDRHVPGMWRIVNSEVRGPLGYPTGFQVKPGHSDDSMLDKDDYPQKRAGFTDHALWVTPYRAEELFAAGDYPTQSHGGDGLPAWTSANRPIENTDIVAWYTFGMHHVVRAEDWPVMPTVWHEFELRPFDFFSRNPALDVARE
jgi:primary-amine oxidase